MTTFNIGWNYTHRGHYLKPEHFKHGLTIGELRNSLTSLIDDVSRTCRIWASVGAADVAGARCVWHYSDPATRSVETAVVVDRIIATLNLKG